MIMFYGFDLCMYEYGFYLCIHEYIFEQSKWPLTSAFSCLFIFDVELILMFSMKIESRL